MYHFCLEATGSYSTAVALFLAEAKQFVSVVNPAQLRYFALTQRQGNTTDKADAQLIAQFCCKETPDGVACRHGRDARVGSLGTTS
jgi:transposase